MERNVSSLFQCCVGRATPVEEALDLNSPDFCEMQDIVGGQGGGEEGDGRRVDRRHCRSRRRRLAFFPSSYRLRSRLVNFWPRSSRIFRGSLRHVCHLRRSALGHAQTLRATLGHCEACSHRPTTKTAERGKRKEEEKEEETIFFFDGHPHAPPPFLLDAMEKRSDGGSGGGGRNLIQKINAGCGKKKRDRLTDFCVAAACSSSCIGSGLARLKLESYDCSCGRRCRFRLVANDVV
jgi:hypothetical protein